MKRLVLFAAVAVVIAGSADFAAAAEFPTYQVTGFPVTAHQVAAVGSAYVEEASPVPALTLDGMPASPHQIAVLTAHKNIVGDLAEKPTTGGGRETR